MQPHGLCRNLGRKRRRRRRGIGCPDREGGPRLHLGRPQPRSGVLDELVAFGGLRLDPQEERPPLDRDSVAHAVCQFVETDRPDITPRSEKVGPNGQWNRILTGASHHGEMYQRREILSIPGPIGAVFSRSTRVRHRIEIVSSYSKAMIWGSTVRFGDVCRMVSAEDSRLIRHSGGAASMGRGVPINMTISKLLRLLSLLLALTLVASACGSDSGDEAVAMTPPERNGRTTSGAETATARRSS